MPRLDAEDVKLLEFAIDLLPNEWQDEGSSLLDKIKDIADYEDDSTRLSLSDIMAKIVLNETCGACPEQYDATIDDQHVGYLRLRHGTFRVECPDTGGELVYHAHPAGDGCFEYDERDRYLARAKLEIARWLQSRNHSTITIGD